MGTQWKQCQTLFFWAPKSLQMVTAAMKLKDAYSLELPTQSLTHTFKSCFCSPNLLQPWSFQSPQRKSPVTPAAWVINLVCPQLLPLLQNSNVESISKSHQLYLQATPAHLHHCTRFPGLAVPNCHKVGSLEQQMCCLIVSEVRCLKLRCW